MHMLNKNRLYLYRIMKPQGEHLIITIHGPRWANVAEMPVEYYSAEEVEEFQRLMRFSSECVSEAAYLDYK
jgi:hypothetical protein